MGDQATSFVGKSWTVPAERQSLRLDAFIRECLPHVSRRQVEAAIRAGAFSVQGRVAKKGDRLSAGDDLRFHGPLHWLAERPMPSVENGLSVIYEDGVILAVDKPAGIATHGFSGRETDTLANRLVAGWSSLASIGKSRWEPGIVHRLDRETSGVLLVAKTQPAFEHLRWQFRHRQVTKTYCALVWGKTPSRGLIDIPLAHDVADKRRMRAISKADPKGPRVWEAITRYRRIAESEGLSLLEIDMKTGVTHQIRAHFGAIGHPIVGDKLYGHSEAPVFDMHRHFLHAHSLRIVHPETARSLTMVADLPDELAEFLRRLKIRF